MSDFLSRDLHSMLWTIELLFYKIITIIIIKLSCIELLHTVANYIDNDTRAEEGHNFCGLNVHSEVNSIKIAAV